PGVSTPSRAFIGRVNGFQRNPPLGQLLPKESPSASVVPKRISQVFQLLPVEQVETKGGYVASASDTFTDPNSQGIEQNWPECWTQEQIHYFSHTYKWLISKNKKLGCSICSHVNGCTDMQQGQRVSHEWSQCLVSSNGKEKAAQQHSLRKKIKEHKDSISHKKADEIKEMARKNTIQTHIEDMRKADFASTCNVFRTAYKIGKHGRPFTDMPLDVQLQVLNGVNMGRVLHSNNTCANILDHIAAEMKKKVVNDIVINLRKLCVLIDESTTISGKAVLVVCLRSAISGEEPDTIFFELIQLQGTSAKDITDALLKCLQQNGFELQFLQDHLLAFGDGASVMLGRKAGVAAQLCHIFPNLFVLHCSNHRLELAVCDVLKEVGGMNHFKFFLDQLYSLYHASPKNQRELTESALSVGQRLLVIGRVLSVRWVASSERTVKAVWESYQPLAKYKGLHDILTSVSFVANLGVMYDALSELSDLSRMLQRHVELPSQRVFEGSQQDAAGCGAKLHCCGDYDGLPMTEVKKFNRATLRLCRSSCIDDWRAGVLGHRPQQPHHRAGGHC
uniref:DUF4371 domain-containing protein n=1 Tax=Oryzias melastigma TaxID=30732 RepID=A0A3B3CDZ6_ORYME